MGNEQEMTRKDDFVLTSSHRSQVPGGAIDLAVSGPEGAEFDVSWSVKPDSGGFDPKKAVGKSVAWTAPEQAATYILTARVAPAGGGSSAGSSGAETAPEPFDLSHRVEVTPMALPTEILEKFDAGVDALRSGLPGDTIRLQRQYAPLTEDKALWAIIRNRTNAIGFKNYKKFVDSIMCGELPPGASVDLRTRAQELRYRGVDAYELLKKATEAFLMHETGFAHEQIVFDGGEERARLPQLGSSDAAAKQEMEENRDKYLVELEDESRTFPYFKLIRDGLAGIPLKPPGVPEQACYGILRSRISPPVLLELIWSYWHEEGMLVQSLKAISMRFQNRVPRSGNGNPQALASMNLDPLRPLSNIVWGYVQDEHTRLTLSRRAYEYDHHYGFTIDGKAVPKLEAADSRTGFLAAFHTLLHRASVVFKEQSDTTKLPDGYPLLNGLRECHLLLAQGAHNQYGDLPWTARQEMLMEQWILARPETRDFLGRRAMVPYPEEWMPAVDQMRDLMGWRGASVRHFQDLAIYGEMILLSIRFGNWSDQINEDVALVWAQYWRQELQAYINAYRMVTGVDLSADADQANQKLLERRMRDPASLLAGRRRAPPPAE